jgi:hypothetical protein
LSTTSALVGFQENIQEFIPLSKTNLKGKGLIAPSTIILRYNVHHNMKCKLDFDSSKSISKQKHS